MAWLVWTPAMLAAVGVVVFVTTFTVGWLKGFDRSSWRWSLAASWALLISVGCGALSFAFWVLEHHP